MQRDCTAYLTPAREAAHRARWILNTYYVEGDTAHIILPTRGDHPTVEALIDADLIAPLIGMARWAAMRPQPRSGLYAGGWRRRQPGEASAPKRLLYLHRAVLELRGIDMAGKMVDHIDGNTLDNRTLNLMAGTARDNSLNHTQHRSVRELQTAVRRLIHCTHKGQNCECKRAALALLP